MDITITLDNEAMRIIKEEVKRQVTEYIRQELILCDIDELSRLTCMNKAYLDRFLLHDPRIKRHERRSGPKGKRFWIYKPTVEAIEYIVTTEW